jgi:RNA polymerase sigma-70 factor (ECF subfamily)
LTDISTNILRNLCKGNASAFEQVFNSFYKQLQNYAVFFVNDSEVAEELVQEAFISLWNVRKRIDKEFNVKAYLFRSIHNQGLNFIRHQKVINEHVASEKSFGDNGKYTEPAPFLRKAIDEAIESLPPRTGMVFKMSKINGMKHKEIAEALNIAEKTVEVQVRKARNTLKTLLKTYYDEL